MRNCFELMASLRLLYRDGGGRILRCAVAGVFSRLEVEFSRVVFDVSSFIPRPGMPCSSCKLGASGLTTVLP